MQKLFVILLVIGQISCTTKNGRLSDQISDTLITDSTGLQHKHEDTTTVAALPRELIDLFDKPNITPRGNYYELKRSSNADFVIAWGRGESKRLTKIDFDLRLAEKFRFDWENDKFIALRASTGSDWWFHLMLPLDNDSSAFTIGNGLAFDRKRNLVVTEWPSPDTVMAIHNLITKESQYIIEKNECGSALTHYCIDSVAFIKKRLYYRWVLPHKIDDNRKYLERSVVVKI